MYATTLLAHLHYLPSVAYCTRLYGKKTLLLDVYAHYQKQSYRNRCYILGSRCVERLVVPIQHQLGKTPYKDVQIDYSTAWYQQHWRALCTAYGKAPFFAYLGDDFQRVLYKKHRFLVDLSVRLLEICLQLLSIPLKMAFTQQYTPQPPQHVVDERDFGWEKNPVGGDHPGLFTRYRQVFGRDFVPNLSIVDLLFCTGPDAAKLLRQSCR